MSKHPYSWASVARDLMILLSPQLDDWTKFFYMSKAIAEADKSNRFPTVGAVIVNEGKIVGQGHRKVDYGEVTGVPQITHAEAMALQQGGELARGSTLYVTLEPCSVMGRAPYYSHEKPCKELIKQTGISRVVIGLIDRDPRNFGKGILTLVKSGISVEAGYNGLEGQLYRLIGNGRFTI